MPDYDLHINPQMRKSAIQLLPPALSCDVEFGTGFLPPETGAPKGPSMAPRREVVWMREPPAAGKAGACPLAEGTSASERSGSKSSSIWQNAYCSLKRRFHYSAALM